MSLALIIDDEVDLCRLMQMTLQKMGINCKIAYDLSTGKQLLKQHQFDFCLTDMSLPDGSGLDLVKLINKDYPTTPVAVITAHGSMDVAIEALKLGAFDFVNKPLELTRLRQLVENALKVAQDATAVQATQTHDPFASRLIGHSTAIETLKLTIQKLARSQAPVFLWGESGTGKEVVAKLIHDLSPRNQANFVPVNCGAIPSELMESEFFGHKKGSFTGATTDKEGLFQQANGGTLFLDEVADLPLAMQVKLLRAIQEKKVRPIGSTQEIAVDIRLLSATHKNLTKLVESGDFRQDLYYRINVIEVKLPSLNERSDDILLLAEHFLQLIAQDWGLDSTPMLSKQATDQLIAHHFAGNVRELRNILERAVTLSDSNLIDASHLHITDSIPTNHKVIPNQPAIDSTDTTSLALAAEEKVTHKSTLQTVRPNIASSHCYSQRLFNSQLVINPATNLPKPIPTTNTKKTTNKADVDTSQLGNTALNKVHDTDKPTKSAIQSASTTQPACYTELPKEGLEEYLLNQERQMIMAALNQSGWNKTQAAKLLNTTFRSLRYRMKKLGIESDED